MTSTPEIPKGENTRAEEAHADGAHTEEAHTEEALSEEALSEETHATGDIPPPAEPRRDFLGSVLAVLTGAVVGLIPFGAGMLVFLDPLFKKKTVAEDGKDGKWISVGTRSVVPADGTPVQTPVTDDVTDAWNRETNQPIGAVYLCDNKGSLQAFNAICPHAGCFVSYSPKRDCFLCPCHNSMFELDGSKIDAAGRANPSPRKLDELEIDADLLEDTGEILVRFVDYYPGQHEQIPKP